MYRKTLFCLVLLFVICLPRQATYLAAGLGFSFVSATTKCAGLFCATPLGKDCLLFSEVAAHMAWRSFMQVFSSRHPRSTESWESNRAHLAQIPAATEQDKALLHFLEKRWLAKTTGFYPLIINWMCPCFGVFPQVHPETTNSYARDPSNKLSQTYIRSVNAWKKRLPHPTDYPLLLTRPGNIADYLPRTVVDIEKVAQPHIGGILIQSSLEQDYLSLLEWISKFGLSANRVELDRFQSIATTSTYAAQRFPLPQATKDAFAQDLSTLESRWISTHTQKSLLFHGTLHLLKGLIAQEWPSLSQTQMAVAEGCLKQITKGLSRLAEKEKELTFFEAACQMEDVHAHLSSLLEVVSVFHLADFPKIYAEILPCIPLRLKPLTSYALHSTGMGSLAGIFKAVEELSGRTPRVLYGENTYFEVIRTTELAAHACPIETATEQDWEEVDLLLVQFNPVLKRIGLPITDYKIEKIEEALSQALHRRTQPLTAAIDCTIDFINSPRIAQLLQQFTREIESGLLNIICYRSGLKFDLFGMDNYCGAPLYMIHSQEATWAPFERLIHDPVLLTDTLSTNWFCLAYLYAAPELDIYRKMIFDNTKALFNRIPERLLGSSRYRVVPTAEDADLAFLDIKVYGPLHQVRAGLIGGFFTTTCMEKKHPLFYRPSIGLYHPNLSLLFTEEYSTIRLTLGLDPDQIEPLAQCFDRINTL